MGLCKCPKRRITIQFCFEHRVNVCDYCVVTNHPKCVVQTYLQWLQDSDYNPVCDLCLSLLSEEDCVRLTCYHVFHWRCLDEYASQLPLTTGPSGYCCPTCKGCLFPAGNVVSPVAEVLREKLASVNWARAGLGLPLLIEKAEKVEKTLIRQSENLDESSRAHDAIVNVDRPPFKSLPTTTASSFSNSNSDDDHRRPLFHQKSPREPFFDHDENKYNRRTADWFFRRWLSLWRPVPRGRHFFSRFLGRLLLLVLALCILLVLLSWLGGIVTRDDPTFDIHNNPNVRVESLKEN